MFEVKAGCTFGVDFGTGNQFQWSVARAVLCVYVIPGGHAVRRAVWQLESDEGPKFACVFADNVSGAITYPAEGQQFTAALRGLSGFDEAAVATACDAVTNVTGGQFVCLSRASR